MADVTPVAAGVVSGTVPAVVEAIVDAIVAAQRTTLAVAPRSRRALRRAAARGMLIAAHRGEDLIGWAIAEPSGRGVVELGSLYVVPTSRDGLALRELTALGTALSSTAVVVTMDPRFAVWLRREWDFESSTLWRVVLLTRGAFLARRLAPWRLVAALRHVTAGSPHYLVRHGLVRHGLVGHDLVRRDVVRRGGGDG